MPDEAPERGRRRLVIVIVLGGVIVLGVVAATFVMQSREPKRSVATLCAQLDDARDLDRSLTSLDPTTLRPQVAALHRAVTMAPNDIEPSVATLSSFVTQVLDAVDAADGDRRTAFAEALDARADQVDAVAAAGRAVTAWASTNCGIELGRLAVTTTTR